MTTGRNDPCPCGSGRKFKRCHGGVAPTRADRPEDIKWRRLRKVLDDFGSDIMDFCERVYGDEPALQAWEEFHCWDENAPAFDSGVPDLGLFSSWYVHVWMPVDKETGLDDVLLGRTPVTIYTIAKETQMDPLLAEYLKACEQSVPSFHTILSVDPGRGFRTRDIVSRDECDVTEASGSHDLQPGDVIYAHIVNMPGLSVIEASGDTVIPPIYKPEIIALRQELFGNRAKVARSRIQDADDDFRELYLDISSRLRNPRMPIIQNTDGDLIEPRKLIFDITSPENAFHSLKHLDVLADAADHAQSIRRDASGAFVGATVRWSRLGKQTSMGPSATALGNIEITTARLTAEANSRKRSEQLKTIIEKALGSLATFRVTEIVPLDLKMMGMPAAGTQNRPAHMRGADSETPEMRDMVRRMLNEHYQTWPDEKLPALGNRTPRQAVKTRDGREMVEALLEQFERDGARQSDGADPEIFQTLRSKLGLS